MMIKRSIIAGFCALSLLSCQTAAPSSAESNPPEEGPAQDANPQTAQAEPSASDSPVEQGASEIEVADGDEPTPQEEPTQDIDDEESTSAAAMGSGQFELDEALAQEWGRPAVYTGQVEIPGYLRFSWLPGASDESEDGKALIMRLFVAEEGLALLPEDWVSRDAQYPPVIGLDDRQDPEFPMLGIAASEEGMKALIDEHFTEVPEHFWTYREGHIQQPGMVTIEGLTVEVVADQANFSSLFRRFEPREFDNSPDDVQRHLDAQAEAAGPYESAVYDEDFMVATGCALHAEADANSQELQRLEAGDLVTKIRTVDDEWVQVHLRGDSDTTGFVQKMHLDEVS